MGKLHTLRRAILRDPDIWTTKSGLVKGAQRWFPEFDYSRPQWKPHYKNIHENASYSRFVRHVLIADLNMRGRGRYWVHGVPRKVS